jgi:sec-independent protein translocase protein TatA
MPFVGTGHIWMVGILLIVVLIIWGPGKLPDVGSGMGRAIREFRKASSEAREQFSVTGDTDAPPTVAAAAPDALAQPLAARSSPESSGERG